MTRVLTHEALAQYRERGYFHPLAVLREDEVARLRATLEAFETARRGRHQAFLEDQAKAKAALMRVTCLKYGADILCWNTIFWIKEPHSASYVSWHQDLKYWGLDCEDLVTAWLALSPATLESGCMRVLPGSHRAEMLPHDDIYAADNMLTRGQEIAVEVDEQAAVPMQLEAGQMSLHNVRLAHASGPNHSDDRRIGISFHYMPTRSRQLLSFSLISATFSGICSERSFFSPMSFLRSATGS